jgi:hypothetical protein
MEGDQRRQEDSREPGKADTESHMKGDNRRHERNMKGDNGKQKESRDCRKWTQRPIPTESSGHNNGLNAFRLNI